jgi:hypothetical protein
MSLIVNEVLKIANSAFGKQEKLTGNSSTDYELLRICHIFFFFFFFFFFGRYTIALTYVSILVSMDKKCSL